jgi:hypothetical protein
MDFPPNHPHLWISGPGRIEWVQHQILHLQYSPTRPVKITISGKTFLIAQSDNVTELDMTDVQDRDALEQFFDVATFQSTLSSEHKRPLLVLHHVSACRLRKSLPRILEQISDTFWCWCLSPTRFEPASAFGHMIHAVADSNHTHNDMHSAMHSAMKATLDWLAPVYSATPKEKQKAQKTALNDIGRICSLWIQGIRKGNCPIRGLIAHFWKHYLTDPILEPCLSWSAMMDHQLQDQNRHWERIWELELFLLHYLKGACCPLKPPA